MQVYGDPELLDDDVDRIDFEDSTKTRLSDLIPKWLQAVQLRLRIRLRRFMGPQDRL